MNRHGGRGSFDLAWVERWARTVNDDRILPVIGRFFTGRFVLGIDEADYLIHVRQGKIERISEGLTPNDLGYDFGLRAPAGASNQSEPPGAADCFRHFKRGPLDAASV